MRLTDRTDFALRVLMVLASKRARCTVPELGEWLCVPTNHLAKVVQTLQQEGWVTTTRGRGGGVELAIDPSQLTVGAVVRKTETSFDLVECFGKDNQCPLVPGSRLASAIGDARDAFLSSLDRVSIAELAGSTKKTILRVTA